MGIEGLLDEKGQPGIMTRQPAQAFETRQRGVFRPGSLGRARDPGSVLPLVPCSVLSPFGDLASAQAGI